MTFPTSTYRLQFRDGMTFDRARQIIGYLKALGISHLYASPVFRAARGSTHGYDVVDPNGFDSALGGEAGFDRLVGDLKAAGIGLILDIVPNHMAASPENRWWLSLLEWGADSPYAGHFDIDWTKRLTLPCLGRPFDEVLADRELRLVADADGGYLAAAYYENRIALDPRTYGEVLRELDDPLALRVAELAAAAEPSSPADFHDEMRALLSDVAARHRLEERLATLASDPAFMRDLHGRQPWRLIPWQDARSELNYRRFFEIAGLAGLKVEDDTVFDDVHRESLKLLRSGRIDGLRIDHVDGLAEPEAYLARLRREAGPDAYIVVEKILAGDEMLPVDWPVAGTTGYEFIAALADLMIDPHGSRWLHEAYRLVAEEAADYRGGERNAKSRMIEHNFDGEVAFLVDLAMRIAESEGWSEQRAEDIRTAIAELLIGFPVYRTYGVDGPPDAHDREVLDAAIRYAARAARAEALALVGGVLSGEIATLEARRFRIRFQQLSGPIMAKALEDTLFYQYNCLLAANEVGGEPERPPGGPQRFHSLMGGRLRRQPNGLSATSTHDTKRGEDARARLYALSEAPEAWAAGVTRWRKMNRHLIRDLAGGSAPEPNVEWMLYQALAGIWPARFDPSSSPDREQLEGRFLAYVEKAVREAKLRTDWLEPAEDYEDAVKAYARNLLSAGNTAFARDFAATLEPFIRTGLLNSLTQTLLKMTAPGVPDIYQGAEMLDFSLVDPDNRRPVAFDRLAAVLDENEEQWTDLEPGAMKLKLVQRCLRLRQERPSLFSPGSYLPLDVTGSQGNHVLAFSRQSGRDFALVVVPRLMHGRLVPGKLHAPADFWSDTAVVLPASLQDSTMRDALTGSIHRAGATLPVGSCLGSQPVVLLLPENPEPA
ncbi:malto-oligosyltrehalose synthase [Rhizobium sp. BK251]|uniref:malto-oligosyltrehalose synthase n=1 Tax=Rhizobium sp. BK251 TaxID=2512125 RepID=UPI00104F5B45|nr:malto-oligosyltrehalose synthase [Rhizobium sp. BK251]